MTLGEAVGYIKLNIEDFAKKTDMVTKESEALQSKLGSIGSTASAISKTVTAAFAAIGTAAVAGIGAAISVGSSFEASMSQVAATMGMTAEQIQSGSESYEALREAAEEAGATTKFTATQAGEALNYLALAGYSVEQSISSLPTVLDLAAAGGMDLASASDMVTDAVSALGLSIEDMSYFSDQMAKTAQKSNTSVAQLGDAILQIGGTAKVLSGGVTELDTALGVLANNGIKAAEGGTALRQIILNLTAPTDAAAKYMEELGLQVADAAGNVRPLNEIFRDLDEILQSKGITGTAEISNALSQIFDARQLKSATALLANYGDTWDKLYNEIDNAEGAASNMAETMSANLQGAVTTFKSALEGVGITIYDSFQVKLTEGVEAATTQLSSLNKALQTQEMQEALSKLSDMLGNAIVKLTEFASDVIPKVLSGFASFVDNLSNMKGLLAGVATTLTVASAGALVYQVQTNAVTAALIAQKVAQLAANAALLANPYTAVAAVLGVLVAGIVSAISKQKEAIAEADKVNEAYYQQESAVRDLADAWDEAKQSADEYRHSNDEQINELNNLYNLIHDNTNAMGTITSCYNDVIEAVNTLNEMLPIDLSVQDGQIVGYGQLTQAVEEYNSKLEAQAELEARRSEYEAALANNQQAKEYFEQVKQDLLSVGEEYQKAKSDLEKFNSGINAYSGETYKAAKEAGQTVREYLNQQYEIAENAFNSVTDTYYLTQQQVSETEEIISGFKKDYPELMSAAGEEVEGIWQTHEEAMRGIAEYYSDDMTAYYQQKTQESVDAIAKQAEEEAAAWSDAQAKLSDLERQFNLGEIASEEEYYNKRLEILNKYNLRMNSDWAKAFKSTNDKISDLEAQALEEEEKKLKEQEEARQKAIEAEKERQEQALRDKEDYFKKQAQMLEDKLYLDDSYTEEMYWNDLQLLTETLDKSSDLYDEYNRKILRGKKDLEAEKLQAAQQALDDENNAYYKSLQDKKKYNDDYTDEQYLLDLQAFIATLDKESKLYSTIADEILSTQKQIADNNQGIADASFSSWESGFNALVSEAKAAYGEIEAKQKSLESSLNNSIDMYEIKTKQVRNAQTGLFEDVEYEDYTAEVFQKQSAALDDYEAKLDDLKSRGASEELMSYILSLSPEKSAELAENLTKMSDSQLKAYDSSYTALLAKNKAFSEKYYSDSAEDFKTLWGQKITDYIDSLPEEAKQAAKELIENFIASLDEQTAEASGGLLDILTMASDTIGNMAKSGDFKNYGTSAVSDFSSGMTQASSGLENQSAIIGSTAGKALFSAFKVGAEPILEWAQSMWNGVKNIFSKELEVSASINAAANTPIVGVPQTSASSQQITPSAVTSSQTCKCLTKQDVIDAIRQTQPSGNVVLNCDGKVLGQIALKELNELSQSTGNLQLHV